MVICPDCGKEVPDAKFCKNCGARLPEIEDMEPASAEVNDVVEDVPEEIVVPSEPVEEVKHISDEIIDDVPEEIVVPSQPVDVQDGVEQEEEIPVEVVIPSKSAEENDSVHASANNEIKFCHNCGHKLEGKFKFCPNCGCDLEHPQVVVKSETKVVTPTKEKNIIISIILSVIFPGLGQIYLGLDRKGALFLIGYVVSLVLILLLIGLVLCLVIWVWALVDTIQSTNALNRGETVEDKLF